jgi:hypothetical protein
LPVRLSASRAERVIPKATPADGEADSSCRNGWSRCLDSPPHRSENGRTTARFGVCRAGQWVPSFRFQSGTTFHPLAKVKMEPLGTLPFACPGRSCGPVGPAWGGGGQREHWNLSACFFRVWHMHPWGSWIPSRMGMTTAGLGVGRPSRKRGTAGQQKRKPSTGRPSGKSSRRSGRRATGLFCVPPCERRVPKPHLSRA